VIARRQHAAVIINLSLRGSSQTGVAIRFFYGNNACLVYLFYYPARPPFLRYVFLTENRTHYPYTVENSVGAINDRPYIPHTKSERSISLSLSLFFLFLLLSSLSFPVKRKRKRR